MNDKIFTDLVEEYKNRKKKEMKQRLYTIGVMLLLAISLVLFFILRPTPIHRSLEKSTMAINTALKEGDASKAIEIFLKYKGDKYELAENGSALSIVKACLADGNLDDAMMVGYAAEMKYESWQDYEKTLASTIYEYCINNGAFDTAKEVYNTANCEFEFHGRYIKDVVTYLCEHGRKDEAQKFLDKNIDIVGNCDKLYKSGNGDAKIYVKRIIQKVINQY